MELGVENLNLVVAFDIGSCYLTRTLGSDLHNLGTCFKQLCNQTFHIENNLCDIFLDTLNC